MRYGEIIGLTWDDIDFKQNLLIIQQAKNGDRRSVPLVGLAKDLLVAHSLKGRGWSNLLFPGKNLDKPKEMRKSWVKALKEAGIKDFRFHDLRHTAA